MDEGVKDKFCADQLIEKNNIIKNLQKLRSEDVGVIDDLKRSRSGSEEALRLVLKQLDKFKQNLSSTEEALELSRNKIRAVSMDYVSKANQDKSEIFDLKETLELSKGIIKGLESTLVRIKKDRDDMQLKYVETFNTLASTKEQLKRLNNINISSDKDKVSRLESELTYLQKKYDDLIDQINHLKNYKVMYYSTVKTLKLHLPN